MVITADIWQTYFYILCKWITIFFLVYCTKEVILNLMEIIRISMITTGPCKALKELEAKVNFLLKEREGK